MKEQCQMCGRPLDVTGDPMSVDCGGDCWGCVGRIEAEGGYEPSVVAVEEEKRAGLRDEEGWALGWKADGQQATIFCRSDR